MPDMSNAKFHILYDGPALESNEMNVRDLAPALLALGQVLEDANTALNDGKAKIAVKVKASFKTGCFGIELDVVQTLLQQAQTLFSNEKVATAKQILEWLGLLLQTSAYAGGSLLGLIGFLKWLRNRTIKRVVLLDDGLVRVELDDAHLVVEQQVIELFRQTKLRQSLEGVLKPLETEGITEFAVTDQKQTKRFITVSRDDVPSLAAPELVPEVLSEQDVEMNLQLVSISFRDDNKWRFSDGSTVFYATVSDPLFLQQVKSNEPFASGDILKASLRRTQSLVGDTMKTDYTLTKVLEHRRAAAQIPLSFEVELPPILEAVGPKKPRKPRKKLLKGNS
ncbi:MULTISPECIES: hypothetical protein [Achromobacter]|uniref:hypothetical protein n=1 Tax=Achromobacter TaxID=222 RepID=UPI0006C2917F|nr:MULTISPECIES: hypothetical protein [Achromobacter]CUJ80717.1 Uncharacterised protein [Achromobacter sp. 2789STDY5608628]